MTEAGDGQKNQGQKETIPPSPFTPALPVEPIRTLDSDIAYGDPDPTINTRGLARETALAAILPVQYAVHPQEQQNPERKGWKRLLSNLLGTKESNSSGVPELAPSANLAEVEEALIRDIRSGIPVVVSGSHPDELRFLGDRVVSIITNPVNEAEAELSHIPVRVDCRSLPTDLSAITAIVNKMLEGVDPEARSEVESKVRKAASRGESYMMTVFFDMVAKSLKEQDQLVVFLEHIEGLSANDRGEVMRVLRGVFGARSTDSNMNKIVTIATIKKGEQIVPLDASTPYNIGNRYHLE